MGLYSVVAAAATASECRKRRLRPAACILLLAVFPLLHISYGVGWVAAFASPAVWRARKDVRSGAGIPDLGRDSDAGQ